jgi:hypothetical protein
MRTPSPGFVTVIKITVTLCDCVEFLIFKYEKYVREMRTPHVHVILTLMPSIIISENSSRFKNLK